MTSESEGERLELRECSFGRVGVSGATVHGSASLVTVPTVRTSQMNQNTHIQHASTEGVDQVQQMHCLETNTTHMSSVGLQAVRGCELCCKTPLD